MSKLHKERNAATAMVTKLNTIKEEDRMSWEVS